RPDVLLLDVMMPEVSGFDILKMLRQDPDYAHLPVIILTSSSDAETKLTALDLGATDFLSKPVDPSELALRVRNTLAAKAYQDQLAYYDVLTNLPNIHLFRDRTNWAIERAGREQLKLALMRISFGEFKKINDALGPEVGDELLIQLANRLSQQVRASDAVVRDTPEGNIWADVFRVDGADFSVLLPSLDSIANVAAVGQRIFDVMREPLQILGNEIYLTPSIGVAGFPDDATDTANLIKCALSASGQAGEQGAGRMQFYSAEM
ncbi:MAG: diguanylate cyclase, partial [bacterium]|nr:diguanylate cyclase [bacterium]